MIALLLPQTPDLPTFSASRIRELLALHFFTLPIVRKVQPMEPSPAVYEVGRNANLLPSGQQAALEAAEAREEAGIASVDVHAALQLVASGISLRVASHQLGVSEAVLWRALNRPEWSPAYMRAREVRAQAMAQEVWDTVQEVKAGTIPADVGRVVLDGCKWLAARLDGRRWGETSRTEVTGAGGGPVELVVGARDWLTAKLAKP